MATGNRLKGGEADAGAGPQRPIFTIGHSTRTIDELIGLLREAGIDLLVDVRSFPRSRTNPQFNIEALPAALAATGVGYRHMKELGGRRGRQDLGRRSPNDFWRNDSFRNYADYALTPPFRAALAELLEWRRQYFCAIMCAEAAWQRCHRQIIADWLLVAGADVRHIVGAGRIEPARLNPAAEIEADGAVVYPGSQRPLI
jgi:uncharacterized protein (DUF488 family)